MPLGSRFDFYDKMKNRSPTGNFVKKKCDFRDVTQNKYAIAYIYPNLLENLRKRKRESVCMIFECFHAKAGVSKIKM